MRKILSLLLITLLLLNVAPFTFAVAEESSDSVAVDMLKELKIIDSSYIPSETMTRLEFVKIISNIFKDVGNDYTNIKYFEDVTPSTPFASDIHKLATYGIIKGGKDALFNGSKPITNDQVTAMLVRMLGYEYAANDAGGFPNGYTVIGANIGLYKDLGSSSMISNQFLAMVYNALDIEVMEQTGWGDNIKFAVAKDKTIFSSVLKVYKYQSVLNAVGKVALSSKYTVLDDEVLIGDVRFKMKSGDKAYMLDALGCNVTGYYTDTDGIYDLLFYKKNTSDELTLNLKDIISISSNEVKYQTENGKVTTVNISPAIYIVYNDRAALELPVLGKNGTIKLVGSYGDFDTMIVKNYTTFVVDYVSQNYYTVSGKYTGEVLPKFDDEEKYEIKTKDGTPVEFKSLAEWDVLSIARSANDAFIELVVSKDKINGQIDEIEQGDSEHLVLNISGKPYYVTQEFYNYINTPLGYSVALEDQGDFYLDQNGNVAGFDMQVSAGIKLGYLVYVWKPMNGLEEPKIKIFTSKGKMEINQLKVKSDNINIEDNQVPLDTFIKNNTTNGVFKRQLIRYEQDSDGVVTKLELAESANREGLYKFNITSGTYRSAQRSFSSNVVLQEKAIVFVVPYDSESKNDKLYTVKDMKYFSSGTSYTGLEIFGFKKDRLAAEVIVRKSNSEGYLGYTTPISVVKKITQGVNAEGNPVNKLYVLKEGKEASGIGMADVKLTETTRDPNDGSGPEAGKMPLTDVAKGDIMRYTTTGQNEVGFVQLFYDRSKDAYMPSSNPMSQDNGNLKIGIGTVLRRDGNIIEFKYRNSSLIEYYYIDKNNIAVYDSDQSEGKEIRTGDVNDIRDMEHFPANPSIVFIHSSYGAPKSVVVYN